ncbi:MAG: tetratricopeptide repeat protein [Chloroflexota bacterium]
MAEGSSNQEIGDTLFITKETVRWYIKIIYSKLGTSRRTEAIALARRFQLIGDKDKQSESQQPSTTFDLPATTGPFVGREDEIEALQALVSRPDVRLVSIVAAGGMGKSRLALEWGHLIKGSYQQGATFIDLTKVQHPDEIAREVLVTLGQKISSQASPREQLFNYCRGKELLLIFDNFEDLLPGAPLLGELLEVGRGVDVIATTRERLNLRAESVFYLHPIDQSGAQLFRELGEMMHSHIQIDPADQPAIERIINLVGGLPLAIVLAAAWLDTLTPTEIAAEIAANLDFLSAEMGDMPERQRSIHALLDPTWGRLSESEREAFMSAAVFRGGFSRDLFQQATGASVRTVQKLLHRSLIEQGRSRRYNLHPLIRQYAAEKLANRGMETTAKKAHLEAFTAYAAVQVERMDQGHYLDGLQCLAVEHDNFRAALDWSLAGENESLDTGVLLAESLTNFWTIRSQMQEQAKYFEMALAHRPDLASLHIRLAFAYYRLGQPEAAQRHNQRATELAEASQAFDILAGSKRFSSFVGGTIKSAEEAEELGAEAMHYAQLSGNQKLIADSHIQLGMLSFDYNIPHLNSLEHFQKALDYYKSKGQIWGISTVIYNMALVHRFQGNTQKARELCERSLELKRQIGDRAGEARRLSALAAWDIEEEEIERAALTLAESRNICEELGERRRLRYTIFQQGVLAMIMGEYKQSENLLLESLKLAQTINEQASVSHAYLGQLYLLTEQIKQAEQQIYQAIRSKHKTHFESWPAMIAYGNLLWQQKEYATATTIAAALEQDLAQQSKQNPITIKYFLKPLVYRVQQRVGEKAWQVALDQAAGMTIEQLVQEMVKHT